MLYLANYCALHKVYDDSVKYCSRLLDFNGREKEEAAALLRDLHKQMEKPHLDLRVAEMSIDMVEDEEDE